MKFKPVSLPYNLQIETLLRASELLETFMLHSIDVAATLSKEYDAQSSMWILDADHLQELTQKAIHTIKLSKEIVLTTVAKDSFSKIHPHGEGAEEFIKHYLQPGAETTTEDEDEFFNLYIVNDAVLDDEDVIAEHIKSMNYKEFLKTPYWKYISAARKTLSYGCEICGSQERLEVHHPTYEWHGYELQHYRELTVLCHDCHEIYHKNKKAEK